MHVDKSATEHTDHDWQNVSDLSSQLKHDDRSGDSVCDTSRTWLLYYSIPTRINNMPYNIALEGEMNHLSN